MTNKINGELKIVYVDDSKRFLDGTGGLVSIEGYAFYHPEKGYYAGISGAPYPMAYGEKWIAGDILYRQGGFTDFDDASWVQPIK